MLDVEMNGPRCHPCSVAKSLQVEFGIRHAVNITVERCTVKSNNDPRISQLGPASFVARRAEHDQVLSIRISGASVCTDISIRRGGDRGGHGIRGSGRIINSRDADLRGSLDPFPFHGTRICADHYGSLLLFTERGFPPIGTHLTNSRGQSASRISEMQTATRYEVRENCAVERLTATIAPESPRRDSGTQDDARMEALWMSES